MNIRFRTVAFVAAAIMMAPGCTSSEGSSDGSDAGCSLEEICEVKVRGLYGCGGNEFSETWKRCCPPTVGAMSGFACNSDKTCCGEFGSCIPPDWTVIDRPDGGPNASLPDSKICDFGQ